ncbi:MAG: flagellar biosynthesis protein FliQ [Rhodoferax sp.]
MNAQSVLTMGQEALMLLIIVSAPVLGAALVVGLLVSLFQAVTQIHEATLAFVPKLLSVVAVLAIAGPWMLTMLVEYIRRILMGIPAVVS